MGNVPRKDLSRTTFLAMSAPDLSAHRRDYTPRMNQPGS